MTRRTVVQAVLIVLGLWLLLAWLYFSGPAHAATLVTPTGQIARPYQRWADRAKAPTTPVVVTVHAGGCPGLPEWQSCTFDHEPYEVWIAFKGVTATPRQDFYHELGHLFDYTVMTDAYRAGFSRIVGDSRTWHSEPNSPHEKFAEGYRLCVQGVERWERLGSTTSDYGPTRRVQRRVCALIRRAATRGAGSAARTSRAV